MSPLAGALALTLGLALQDDRVTFEARVDKQNHVFVDVKNPAAGPVRVTLIKVSFFDASDRLIDQVSVDCEDDCGVAASATESFGPIEGPRGWQNVRAMDVQFKRMPPRSEAPRAPAQRSAEAALAAPPATPRVGRPAGTDWASPEAVLRGFYVALNLGDLGRAREFYTRAANDRVTATLGTAGFESWGKRETEDGTVIDLRLVDKLDEATGSALAEIEFADVPPAKRRVVFKKEGPGWKIERLEPVS